MYYIKWRDLSYIHCSWETDADLIQLEGIHIRQKIQVCTFLHLNFNRVLQKQSNFLTFTINPNHHFEHCS